jgi:hypothetical protein
MLNKMASFFTVVGIAGVLSTASVASSQAAETMDMTTFSCNQFMSSSVDSQDLVLFWLDGYLSHKTSNLVITFDHLDDNYWYLADACEGQPNTPVIDALLAGIQE